MSKVDFFNHRLPFSSEELLLLAGLSCGVLKDSNVAHQLVCLAKDAGHPPDVEGLKERLREFLANGVKRNAKIRGENLTTTLVRSVLQDDYDEEFSDEQLELQP